MAAYIKNKWLLLCKIAKSDKKQRKEPCIMSGKIYKEDSYMNNLYSYQKIIDLG